MIPIPMILKNHQSYHLQISDENESKVSVKTTVVENRALSSMLNLSATQCNNQIQYVLRTIHSTSQRFLGKTRTSTSLVAKVHSRSTSRIKVSGKKIVNKAQSVSQMIRLISEALRHRNTMHLNLVKSSIFKSRMTISLKKELSKILQKK